ncbi:MAG: 30S ribosomal protein S2 [Methylococcaceae bacterium TMED69]|nr:MAG: 30S ribosomal protein S2 [Methylococcaceae bacterium TMED69]
MASINMRQLLEAGVHFGHQTRFWHPKMAPFIYGQRNKIHIINLDYTLKSFRDAINFLSSVAASGGQILYVGTKRSAQQSVAREASRAGMPYVSKRWLGGMLTNFKTVKQSIKRLHELEKIIDEGGLENLSKKEGLILTRELNKLNLGLGGIKNMEKLPDALFVIDVGFERIAVSEASKLGIPVVGIVDTNNSPVGIDYVIPGNDDATRSIDLYTSSVTDAILDAKAVHTQKMGEIVEEFVEVEGPSDESNNQSKNKGSSTASEEPTNGLSNDSESNGVVEQEQSDIENLEK